MTEPAADQLPATASSVSTEPMEPVPQPSAGQAPAGQPQPIVARAGSYYRSRRYIMVAALVLFGAWFAYDGWVKYPRNNVRIDEVTRELNETRDDSRKAVLDEELRKLGAKTSDFNIFLQKVLAFAVPVLGLGYLAFFLYRSRGEIVLNGDVLSVPGHPPVNIREIRSIDNRQWKKKGIAYLTYASGGQERRIRLDDFIYDQTPIDDIYAVIAKHHNLVDAAPGLHTTQTLPKSV